MTLETIPARQGRGVRVKTGIVEADNGAVYFRNRVYILNRFGFDNISVVETAAPEAVPDLPGLVEALGQQASLLQSSLGGQASVLPNH